MPHPDLPSLESAHARIAELESQVKILTLRATSAVERATEYEVSLSRMLSTSRSQNSGDSLPPSTAAPTSTPAPTPAPAPAPTTSRLARLLSTRSVTSTAPALAPANSNPMRVASAPPDSLQQPPPPPTPSEASLQAALTQEQNLRQAAEKAAAQTNSEIEELTGQLFEQANEMVAQERKARAKLEARVEVLEKRDNDKARRLGVLEMRVQRVERVRGLLKGED
ncbi:MAG: hypothetical protein MMC23_003511 [Stictis urceolatum]|nr:hypothetical protein [Stictis urceolata]